MASCDLILDRAILPDSSVASIGIANGRIAVIDRDGAPDHRADARRDLGLALVAPGFVDGHLHLDCSFIGDAWRPHRPCAGAFDVAERVAIQKEMLKDALPVEQRAAALIELAVSQGTSHIRSHVEIDLDLGLAHFEAVLAARDRYGHAVTIQIVGFPRGLVSRQGTRELLDEAMHQGADIVGGLDPAGFEGDVHGHLDAVFALAERHGAGIDIHLHDPGYLGLFELGEIAERTRAHGMGGRVAVSHAWALGEVPPSAMARTAERLAEAGVAIMTNAPGSHPFPPVLALRAAGVTVFAGNDDVRDAWWPYGDADMLERAMLIGYRSGFYTDDELAVAFDLATASGAKALGLEDYGLAVGAPADLMVLVARNVAEAVVARPRRRDVYKAGRLVARDGTFGAGPSADAPQRQAVPS